MSPEQYLTAENSGLIALLEELLAALERGEPDLAKSPAEEMLARLRCGWLTPASHILDHLEEMAPASTRSLEPLLLRRAFQQLTADRKARLVRVLESKGWTVEELATMAGCTPSWIYHLRRVSQLPQAYQRLLELKVVSEPQLRATGSPPRGPKNSRPRR